MLHESLNARTLIETHITRAGGGYDSGGRAADVHVLGDLPPRDPAAGGRLHEGLHLPRCRTGRIGIQGCYPDGNNAHIRLSLWGVHYSSKHGSAVLDPVIPEPHWFCLVG